MNIAIIGCGVYSMAMAKRLSKIKTNNIKVWTEDSKKALEFKDTRKVKSIFKDEVFDNNIEIFDNFEHVLKDCNIIFLMISSAFMKSTLDNIKPFYSKNMKIIIGTKGFDLEDRKFFSNVVRNTLKTNNIAVIAGPSFAIDILNNEILALTVATKKRNIYEELQKIYKDTNTKLERSKDLVGVQLSSVLKNIYAIGSGIFSGLKNSEATGAIYLTKVIKELNEILYMFDCEELTIFTLASFGDTIMTCTDDKSRNFTYGFKLTSKNKNTAKNYLEKNTVEGYENLKGMYKILKKRRINANILYTIHDIVFNEKNPKELENELFK